MRASTHFIVLLCFLSSLSCGQDAPDLPKYEFATLELTQPLLSDLKKDQAVVLEAVSTGCLDFYEAYRYELTGPTPLNVQAYEGNREEPIAWTAIGAFTLDIDDVLRLDRLIAFYRKDVDDVWCTSTDRVTIRWTTDNVVRLEEQFVDATCLAQEGPEVLPIWQIAQLATTGGM